MSYTIFISKFWIHLVGVFHILNLGVKRIWLRYLCVPKSKQHMNAVHLSMQLVWLASTPTTKPRPSSHPTPSQDGKVTACQPRRQAPSLRKKFKTPHIALGFKGVSKTKKKKKKKRKINPNQPKPIISVQFSITIKIVWFENFENWFYQFGFRFPCLLIDKNRIKPTKT